MKNGKDKMLFAGGSGQELPVAATFKVDHNEMTAAEKDKILVGMQAPIVVSYPNSPHARKPCTRRVLTERERGGCQPRLFLFL